MSIDIVIPALGESITEGTITTWRFAPGDPIRADEPLLEVETDKISVEIPAPATGILLEILTPEGSDVPVGAVVARMDAQPESELFDDDASTTLDDQPKQEPAPDRSPHLSPAVRRLVDEHGLNPATIDGTGPRGRITKADVLDAVNAEPTPGHQPAQATITIPAVGQSQQDPDVLASGPVQLIGADGGDDLQHASPQAPSFGQGGRRERRVAMTRLRRRVAERLKEVQNTAAILTTFNEVDMHAIIELRAEHKDAFLKSHGVKLGFMSFFVKAAIEALKDFPTLNASVQETEIVYHDYYDVGVAVSTERGLVVPVLRDADRMSFAAVEKGIARLAEVARSNKLTLDQLSGATFSITNGGVFGSMLSTPILNPPQTGILGMHAINKKPHVVGDQIVIRPIMYLALSYDHRIVDGAQAVQFLVKIKHLIENPARLLLEV